MKKTKAEYDTRIFVNMGCKRHSGQVSKFYCSNLDCQTHLCQICLKKHPKEHLPTLTTIENVKEKALTSIESQIENKLKKNLQTILRSDQMHRMFKETFFTLMQQNTTMILDEEDVADIVADTLARKFFPTEVSIPQMTERNCTLDFEMPQLMSFDYKFDGDDDFDQGDDSGAEDSETENKKAREWYEEYQRKFSVKSSKFYGLNPLKVLHLQSKHRTLIWNAQYQKLYDDYGSNGGQKYTIPKSVNLFTVLDPEEPLLIAAADKKLIFYSIENDENLKDNQPLTLLKEIPHNENVFLESDSKKLFFGVSVTLEASIYWINNELELRELTSFRLPDIPKNVLIDPDNGLLFIQYENKILEIYKNLYQTPRLIKKFGDSEGIDFSWHQSSRKLLLLSSGKLYQLEKGKFKLLRVVDKSIECRDLTEFGIIGTDEDENLCLLSQKNPTKQKFLTLPSIERQMDQLQDDRFYIVGDLLDPHGEKEIGDLEINFKKIKLVAEIPTHLLIYLNMTYHQSATYPRERKGDEELGGTIFTQWLLTYDLENEIYQVSYE